MSQSAVSQKQLGSGREQKTDGLWTHLGEIDGGLIRARSVVTPRSGQSLELHYDPSPAVRTGYVMAYDRDINAPTDLLLSGRSITLQTNSGGTLNLPAGSIPTAAIQFNAVQQNIASYVNATTWSTTVVNAWVATAVTINATTAGGLLRVEMSVPFYHSVLGGTFYVGFMMDGGIQVALAYFNCPGQNYTMHFAGTYYVAPAPGLHSFTIAVYNGAVGTLAINAAAAATLYVTEQKR